MYSLCTDVTLDEARERTSVSWMKIPCSGHVVFPRFGERPLIGQCFIWKIYDKWRYFIG
jgi:hypothetical protein